MQYKIKSAGNLASAIMSIYNSLQSVFRKEFPNAIKESESDVRLLVGALVLFAKNDAKELFNSEKDVDERAMSGCVYRYMYCAVCMGLCIPSYSDLDIEYDRMRVDGHGMASKMFSMCTNAKESCKKCQKGKCRALIEEQGKLCDKCNQYEKRVRPDLIIHKRNSQFGRGNGMIVEFKRSGVGGYDDTKLAYSTCSRGNLKYRLGAKVTLSSNMQTVEFYRDSVVVSEIRVWHNKVEY